VGVGEVVVGDPAVAVDSPASGPGVADEELVGLVVVPNSHHSVAAEVAFRWLGHGDQSAGGGDGGLEALVDGDAEDEGDAGSQAGLERPDVGVVQVGGIGEAEFVGLDEALLCRDVGKALGLVGPKGLGTGAEFLSDGGAELEAGTEVLLDGTELGPFVPVDEQAGGHDWLLFRPLKVYLDRCGDGVGRAAA